MKAQVWVGCLAHYNNGELIGDWVDAVDAPDWVCPKANPNDIYTTCEETWCLDHEIPGLSGECSPMEAKAWGELLAQVEDHEEDAFCSWLSLDKRDPHTDTIEDFRDAYEGQWDSPRAHAENYIDEVGGFSDKELPAYFMLEFDDVAWDQDFTYGPGGHVFRG